MFTSKQEVAAALLQQLRMRKETIEFLLRTPLVGEPQAYLAAQQTVANGRATFLELSRLGRELDVRCGALLQWVLPVRLYAFLKRVFFLNEGSKTDGFDWAHDSSTTTRAFTLSGT